MKRYILSILVCAFAAVACINDNIDDYGPCRGAVLQLSITDSETRANGDGASLGTNDDLFNEDAINKVDIFLYPTGATSSNAVWHETISLSDTRETASLAPQVDNNVLESLGLANDGDGCVAYIVVNGPDAVSNATTTDVESLKAVMLTAASFGKVAEYDTGKPAPSSTDNTTVKLMSVAPQDDFVMDSEVVALTYSKSNNKVTTADSNPIYVRRAAAKIRLTLSVADEIVIDGETWTPQVDAMSLAFYNGVNKGRVGGYSDATVEDAPEGSFFDVSGVDFDYQGVMSDITQPGTSAVTRAAVSNVTHVVPFYSYPSDWDVDLAEDAAYFQVVVPWGVTTDKDGNWIEDEDINYISYRYNVPINMLTKQLERNKFYNIVLNIGVLGNLDFIDETSHSFYVTEWNNQAIDITLNRPLYLTVENNYVVMNNVEDIRVGYRSSDDVKVEIVSSTIGSTAAVYKNCTVSVDTATEEIVLRHQLDNEHDDTDKTYDYLPQTIVVRISHIDNPDIYEEVEFVQYPAMYVTAEKITKNTVYINGNNRATNGWWYVRGSSSASQNMYTITVSAFDTSTADYIIADPREPANNNNFVFRENMNANSSVRTTVTDASGDNTLTGYRGAITGAISEQLIAPQMLFSSSWISNGSNSITSYSYETNGKYRCAGYQENGYPAGRWRLPTPAEILFVGRLGAEGKIEGIFVDGVTYLSSNGAYTYSEDYGGSVTYSGTTSRTLRCVYDLWYWNDKCADITDFIWGADGDNLEAKREEGYLTVIK